MIESPSGGPPSRGFLAKLLRAAVKLVKGFFVVIFGVAAGITLLFFKRRTNEQLRRAKELEKKKQLENQHKMEEEWSEIQRQRIEPKLSVTTSLHLSKKKDMADDKIMVIEDELDSDNLLGESDDDHRAHNSSDNGADAFHQLDNDMDLNEMNFNRIKNSFKPSPNSSMTTNVGTELGSIREQYEEEDGFSAFHQQQQRPHRKSEEDNWFFGK
uniref:Transmembrane protein n=1 Tax=Strombidium inclinatum TaxID=197538 RepID=A0A7S3MU10_9SPIT|mmetsp:Transcript_13218/g.20617  ORF Transcript_13218/g.20617 Transcript_13218/m.20617 type:complete len:213 (+) Transcript_13218:481-1119(+)